MVCLLVGEYVVVQLYPWFNFYFPLFYTHYHTLSYNHTIEPQQIYCIKVSMKCLNILDAKIIIIKKITNIAFVGI